MKKFEYLTRSALVGVACTAGAASIAIGEVPNYFVDVVETYSASTTLRGASDAGHFVGHQVVGGATTPFVATPNDGLQLLPLPPGYDSGTASGVNDTGVVVGAVDDAGSPLVGGEPAIWTPDGTGGYTVTIPQQFATVPSPTGPRPIDGGICVDINNNGMIVGLSRIQGTQDGPTTQFFPSAAPVNVQQLGFDARVRAVSDQGVICGDQFLFDLGFGLPTLANNIGLPQPLPDGRSFTEVIAFSINGGANTVVAANLEPAGTQNWLTYTHSPVAGFSRLNPSETPQPSLGFYDNNISNDVASSSGVFFKNEGVLETDINALIDPIFSQWDAEIGFIDNDRRMYTTATNTSTGQQALVLLTREVPTGNDPCGTWERVTTPNPGTVRNNFVDAEEANGTVYALLASADDTQVRPPLDWHVLRRDGNTWTDLGGPTNVDDLQGLEFNALGVAPDGTIWLGGLFFPMNIGQNSAPVVASYDPGSGTWSAPEEVQIPDTAVVPNNRRAAQIRTIEVAPNGTVFAAGGAQGFGGGQAGIDASVPLFLINDGSGFVETFVAPFQDWPGGSGRGAGTFLNDAIAFASDDVWLAGRHSQNGTISGGLLLHWDGSVLNVEEDPDEAGGGLFLGRDFGGIDGNAPDDLRVAGQNFIPEDPFGTLGHFDGTDWSLDPTFWLDDVFDTIQSFDEIVVAQDGTAWATGVFAETQTPYYDGSIWSLKPFLPAAPPSGSFIRIRSMAEDVQGTLWAFGETSGQSYAIRLACGGSCTGDLTGDGEINFSDVNAFTAAFQTGDPAADLNGDGSVGFEDLNAFVAAFAAGCP